MVKLFFPPRFPKTLAQAPFYQTINMLFGGFRYIHFARTLHLIPVQLSSLDKPMIRPDKKPNIIWNIIPVVPKEYSRHMFARLFLHTYFDSILTTSKFVKERPNMFRRYELLSAYDLPIDVYKTGKKLKLSNREKERFQSQQEMQQCLMQRIVRHKGRKPLFVVSPKLQWNQIQKNEFYKDDGINRKFIITSEKEWEMMQKSNIFTDFENYRKEQNMEIVVLEQIGLSYILAHIRQKMGLETTVIDADGRSPYHNQYLIKQFASVAEDAQIEKYKRELAAKRGQFPYGPVKLRDDPNWNPEFKMSLIDTIVQLTYRISTIDGQQPWDRGSAFPLFKQMFYRYDLPHSTETTQKLTLPQQGDEFHTKLSVRLYQQRREKELYNIARGASLQNPTEAEWQIPKPKARVVRKKD